MDKERVVALEIIERWDLSYHTGQSISFLERYHRSKKEKEKMLKQALRHLVMDFSNTYRREREDCRASFELSTSLIRQDWAASSAIEKALICFKQMKNPQDRLRCMRQAIRFLQEELALYQEQPDIGCKNLEDSSLKRVKISS